MNVDIRIWFLLGGVALTGLVYASWETLKRIAECIDEGEKKEEIITTEHKKLFKP